MTTRLRRGDRGQDVARLHRVLRSAGLVVEPGEVDEQEFGTSTLAALRELQAKRGLPADDEIDDRILIMLEQDVIINVYVNEAGPTPVPEPNGHHGHVTGKLVNGDGAPLRDIRVSLFAKRFRSEARLGEGRTSDKGVYEIRYRHNASLNLIARAYDHDGSEAIAESPIAFAAPTQLQIDLTTAKDGVVRTPARFTALKAQIAAELQGTPFGDLKENKETHELRFLASSIGAPFADIAYMFIAHVVGAKNVLRDETLFGVFHQGIPASLDAALAGLPDAGIDQAFTTQVFTGVLAHSRSALGLALTAASRANVLPTSYADAQSLELNRLDELRIELASATPYIRGKTPVADLLAASTVTDTVKTAFIKAFAENGGRLGPTWKTLRANKTLSKLELATLNTTLNAGELLGGNLPLVKDTLQQLSKKALARVQDLALLDQADWIARITALDPLATSIPQVLPDDTPEQRIARFAKALDERFAARYPSTAFVGGLTKAQTTAFRMKTELVSVLSANPSLDLKRTLIDQYIVKNEIAISAPALAELKTAQRLLRLSPHYASVEALKTAGYASAQSVYFRGRDPFIAEMTQAMGSASLAKMAYARAHMTYATALTTFARFNLSLNGVGFAAMASSVPDNGGMASPAASSLLSNGGGSGPSFAASDAAAAVAPAAISAGTGLAAAAAAPAVAAAAGAFANLPDIQTLFGSLDYFKCSDCQSVYSPAAYLVDLLQYLRQFSATPLPNAPSPVSGITNARDALLFRRPEIQYIALDCSNTDVTLPYIDLVNEILEAVIAPPSSPPPQPIIIDTAGTSAERRALPQNISQAAYKATSGAVFPLVLPFDLPFAQMTAYLAAMGSSRAALMTLFAGGVSGASPATIACATFGINQAMRAVVNGTDGHQPWELWGFATSNPTEVVNPKTRAAFTPTDWVSALSVVPVLLNRASLSLQQLYQLLEVTWVTQASVTLQLGTPGGILSSDTDLMTFTGLTADVLGRANRFLRLFATSGLQMWELDWALQGVTERALDDAFLAFLAGAVAVTTQLKLPLQEILSFWDPLETRDITNHLTDEDTVVPSTYSEVFANPTMLASWISVFPPVASQPPGSFALNADPIIPVQATPTATESANLNATTAALGISGDDVAAILSATNPPTANALTLSNLNVLLRYARLASSLSLTITDLILWIELTGAEPFGTTPADTLEFLRRLAVLREKNLRVRDLDYLLRDQSATQSALAFTTVASKELLQSIRDAIAKLTPDQQGDAPTVATVFVSAIATATNATANVVTPALSETGILPLPVATIAQLVQSATVDPVQFPQLVSAFVRVSKATALCAALGASHLEFAFVVQNAATFGWLDPSRLSSSSTSPYPALEALLRALKLEHRQSARAPKLFDVLGQWLITGQLPSDTQTAIAGTANVPSLAAALNASVEDVAATVNALGATPPSVSVSTQQGSLCDMGILTSIANALDVVSRYGVRGTTLVSLASSTPDASTASAAQGAFQAQYAQSAWFGAVQPVEDTLRQSRRDALVAYLLGPGANLVPMYTFLTTDDVLDYFLIDPEMCACALSTRLLQASLAIQQFVQQCFLNLSVQVSVDTTNAKWNEWSWRQRFRLWQANRKVFLYPENYVLPELRKYASPFFKDVERDLRQGNCDAVHAEAALENYLRKLVEVSHLVVAAHYNQSMADGSVVLHVFAHTRGAPRKWFYRTRTTLSPGAAGTWTAWETLNLDIASDQLVPVVWDQRLHLVWPIFKPQTEKQRDQPVPNAGGGGSQPPPAKFWAVDFAMSELSAGQWQAKRVLAEKMFFKQNEEHVSVDVIDRPPIAFTFRAAQTPGFDLVISAYYNLSAVELNPELLVDDAPGAVVGGILGPVMAAIGAEAQAIAAFGAAGLGTMQVATGKLSMPEAPLTVVQDARLLPAATLVDLSQEPTRALITPSTLTDSLATPTQYNFSGQDLVCGHYFDANPGSVPLYVLCQTTASGPATSVELLGSIANPRIVVPQQESVFDSIDPFFVVDSGGGNGASPRPARTYLVEPEFSTISSNPQELTTLAYIPEWATHFAFQTFYHPYARTMLRELEIGGVPRLMSRQLQTAPLIVRGWSTIFDFQTIFNPQPPVATPYPGQANARDVGETALDFAPGSTGACSLYNWEVFYHIPMFVAAQLTQNRNFKDAVTWLEHIFTPADTSGGPTPQRFWQTAPFFELNQTGWVNQQIENILTNLAQGTSDAATTAALAVYMNDPFDPHAIASLRIAAYAKATVMQYLDNLIAWADSLFATYTAETVGQAEQLYILADLILGPRPDEVRLPPQTPSQPLTYSQIESQLKDFSDPLVAIENLVVAPIPPQQLVNGLGPLPFLPQLPGSGNTLFFCVPPNGQLLSYWTTVADRLYKIRHCLNLQGQSVPLPLYAPAIDPLLAAEAGAAAQIVSGIAPQAPIYRFATYLQKCVELTNDVRSFGVSILSALEKKDAESLAVLRANQELDIQTRMLDVKTLQVAEANDQIAALQNQKALSQLRFNFYSSVAFMNTWETQAMDLHNAACDLNRLAIPLDLTAILAHLVPSFSFGVAGFGGSPEVSASWGGGNLAASAQAGASAIRASAGVLSESGAMVGTLGQYQRRMDEWNLQKNLASAEVVQIESQITAAKTRLDTAKSELAMQNAQIENSQALSDFLTNKYTNAQLYDWMVTQLTTVHAQAYQLACGLAQQAQAAYQYELGRYQDTFVQFSYWDSQHGGLTAGESLLFDLRRMEAQYLAQNSRELELTKHVSLAMTQPLALVQLIETGTCQVLLNEALFDADHPGHYFRRLRNVALTVPCVTGPYTGVNANLTLTTCVLRVTATLPSQGYVPASAQTPPADPSTFSVTTPGTTIATSTGQDDSGLFEVNLRDERWLPFEGQGAVSAWTLELNPASNNFDFSTITDVILHVRYTARAGIAESTVLAATAPPAGAPGSVLVSVKRMFSDAFYSFFNPVDATTTQQVLVLPLTSAVFPFSNVARPKIRDINLFFVLSQAAAPGTTIAATFGPTTGTASPVNLTAMIPPGWLGTPAILNADTPISPPLPPQSFTLTVPLVTVPVSLATTVNGQVRLDRNKIQDIALVITYET